jgi:ribosomal protein S18 acetylase RimI-like enzyme
VKIWKTKQPTLEEEALLSRVEIRLVNRRDLPALEWDGEYAHFRRLYREVYQSASQGQALMWMANLAPTGIVGQVFVQLNSARKELADGAKRAYVYGFRVRPTYQNKGIGSMLLSTIEGDLLERNFKWVTLNVGRQNTKALRFYERHGYRIVASESGDWSYLDEQNQRHEVHEPAWRMQKHILRIR